MGARPGGVPGKEVHCKDQNSYAELMTFAAAILGLEGSHGAPRARRSSEPV
jgi:hypothetical protein